MEIKLIKQIYKFLKLFGFDDVYVIWHIRNSDNGMEIEGMARLEKEKTYKFNLKITKKMEFKSIIFIKTEYDFYFRGEPMP